MRLYDPNEPWIHYQRGEGCTATFAGLVLMILLCTGLVLLAIGCLWLIGWTWDALF